MKKRIFCVLLLPLAAVLCLNCSVNTLVANALTGEGSSSVFTGDTDPKLVGDALPFAIKMYEALLDSTPNHQGLMRVTGSLFVMYANVFVQGPAEMLPVQEWEAREESLKRAKQLYLRGNAILYNALNEKYRGFSDAAAREDTLQAFLKKYKKEDVGLLYWAVASGLAAFSLDIFDFDLAARISEWKIMIERAYELDPHYGGAALDEFLILFYGSLPELLGGDKERAKRHFQLALEKTGGNSAGAYISYAQSICVPARDYETFKDSLEKALAIDPDADVSTRLVTIISQRKARWMLDNAWNYFPFLPIPAGY
ncbi:MAG: TRAP transporter TatT component family protein [Treponema sp.]|jgi:predicted anti-sigma-YlaC factor YlaD|nr:TRAP transporter TatT component family protein [Treponema sp.]